MKPVVLVLGSYAPSLVNFRGYLLRALRGEGYNPLAVAPELAAYPETKRWLAEERIQGATVPMDRTGRSPFRDVALLIALVRLMRRRRPAVFLGYTIKPVIYGLLAAWLTGVPRRYALITGVGYALTGSATGLRRYVRLIVRWLYRLALSHAHRVIFQNADDAKLFRELGLVARQSSVAVVSGSGVALDHFTPEPMPPPDAPFTFVMVGRLLKSKGVAEFAQAASIVKMTFPHARFVLVGGHDRNPDSIDKITLRSWIDDGLIDWVGEQDDVRPLLANSHVCVLPSYREGTPRSILEAMATGRAIITTDAPGCRETVVEGENGFLIPVRNSLALAASMLRFLSDPALAARLGRGSLSIVREKYDVHLVNRAMLKAMEIAE